MSNLLLLSNSTAPGRPYLAHAEAVIRQTLNGVARVAFVPYALADHDAYTAQVANTFRPWGIDVVGVHTGDPTEVMRTTEALFIGGGNTFRLVERLHREQLLEPIRDAVGDGMPYLGSSAGTNVAAPSLRTTNDMPIVEPPSFDTLGLVPFQINPHYLDPDPRSTHQGETRARRLEQYLEENDGPVLAMREGTWIRRRDATLTLEGDKAGARLFLTNDEPRELTHGTDLTFLLDG